MKIEQAVIIYHDDENGVSRPSAMLVDVYPDPSDPVEVHFNSDGSPRHFPHTMNVSLLVPRPEDDINANLSAEKIANLKADALHHARNGVYVDWDGQIASADRAVALAVKAVEAGEPGADDQLVEANERKAVADARVVADWMTWAKSRI